MFTPEKIGQIFMIVIAGYVLVVSPLMIVLAWLENNKHARRKENDCDNENA